MSSSPNAPPPGIASPCSAASRISSWLSADSAARSQALHLRSGFIQPSPREHLLRSRHRRVQRTGDGEPARMLIVFNGSDSLTTVQSPEVFHGAEDPLDDDAHGTDRVIAMLSRIARLGVLGWDVAQHAHLFGYYHDHVTIFVHARVPRVPQDPLVRSQRQISQCLCRRNAPVIGVVSATGHPTSERR